MRQTLTGLLAPGIFILLFSGNADAQHPPAPNTPGIRSNASGIHPNTSGINPYAYSIQRKTIVTHGAVVSAHPLASAVGVSILQKGGNAFDAAIATQLALAVVYPAAGNIGGGGFMIAHLVLPSRKPTGKNTPGHPPAKAATPAPTGREIALDFREKAPAAATRDMYLDAAGNPVPGLSENGHLASGVPGTIAGIGNADMTDLESYQANPHRTYQGRAVVIVRSTREPGTIILSASAPGLESRPARIHARTPETP